MPRLILGVWLVIWLEIRGGSCGEWWTGDSGGRIFGWTGLYLHCVEGEGAS